MPRKVVHARENLADEARCAQVDVAVGANEALGDRPHALDDPLSLQPGIGIGRHALAIAAEGRPDAAAEIRRHIVLTSPPSIT